MATNTKVILSGSTNGQPVKVVGTATGTATAVHTVAAGTTTLDEVWIFANNVHTATVKLTIEFGGKTAPNNTIVKYIPANTGLDLIISGLVLNNGLAITAFADVANVVILSGYVNRIG